MYVPDKTYTRYESLKDHKYAILGAVLLILTVIFLIFIILGRFDCEITHLTEGVFQTCECSGLEITVKSITNSGEQKTVCLGRIVSSQKFK